MPVLNSPDTERLTLGNGLNVVLCHAPRLRRAAASIRVAAGSHDVPARWPGLAHFLEHLFFLGTLRFAGEQNLMAFVQRHGGQINASTRERTTDFFFELPTAVFADGVERLCDMLAHPRMDPAEQLREREVLHAEFIAWSRDAEARDHAALLAPVNAQHPLRGFHAGNRYSLAVPNPAFQQALNDFYRRFYQAGQMTLCLSGPQPLAELRELAQQQGALFFAGRPIARHAPAPLLSACLDEPSRQQTGPCASQRRFHLLFACESLPSKAEEAVAFICHWLNTPKPGGLIAELVDRGLIRSLKAASVYQFDGQLLLDIDLQGTAPGEQSAVAQLFFSWLAFFKEQWPALVAEFDAVQQRRLQTSGALELAHHYSRDLPGVLSHEGGVALEALIAQLTPASLLTRHALQGYAGTPVNWQLPPPNPFLQSAPCATLFPSPADSVVFHRALPTPGDEAAIYLRWQLREPQPHVWRLINEGLLAIAEDARQAGTSLSFSAYGPYWEIKLTGIRQPMAAILEHALRHMAQADASSQARSQTADNEPPPIPIRQLLKVLPDRFLASPTLSQVEDSPGIWTDARWLAFAVGLPQADEPSINAVLSLTPGTVQAESSRSVNLQSGRGWFHEATDSSEDAVLVFCPTPRASIADEAAWRMLGHLLQGPFYQRLRVELQLGYAVFSGLRQISGRTGLLFGVQSPACGTEQLLRHIETFIDETAQQVAASDLATQKRALIAQFDPLGLPNEQLAALLWHAHLAGHDGDYLSHLESALAALDYTTLLEAARNLADARAGWLILANRPAPGSLPER
ncbi:pyrroloquinoline quinone biosynthesis protein PqqF [Pseudomonas sp. v388]|uniref:pyrroloquinoline quinone biosynthesis protein PqqF n=1 Tax=Pseudomonas sp. v388 TaxID=2479849 RepID=UPI000F78DCD3|nr:pyrroloquinoline quinone biosynthesis protein PqqF [Pseudomonas sp. v388]RRV04789.1 pyrroloquinoline quinone biosynthesis protein PqqF [Pseudomonas sp. v388]